MVAYIIHIMEAHKGYYTGHWDLLEHKVLAPSAKKALFNADTLTENWLGKPTITKPRKGLVIFEFDNAKYAVEKI